MKSLGLPAAKKKLSYLPRGLLAHCQRTSDLCRELAWSFGVDEGRAAWAGLVHDLARPFPPERMLALAEEYGIAVEPIEAQMPLLLHGPVGAEVLRREWGVSDEAVLEAVACHTTGRVGMGTLTKLVFLADKLEPGKAELYPHLERVRGLVENDLDRALLAFFNIQVQALGQEGLPVHPAMLQARDSLLGRLQG